MFSVWEFCLHGPDQEEQHWWFGQTPTTPQEASHHRQFYREHAAGIPEHPRNIQDTREPIQQKHRMGFGREKWIEISIWFLNSWHFSISAGVCHLPALRNTGPKFMIAEHSLAVPMMVWSDYIYEQQQEWISPNHIQRLNSSPVQLKGRRAKTSSEVTVQTYISCGFVN